MNIVKILSIILLLASLLLLILYWNDPVSDKIAYLLICLSIILGYVNRRYEKRNK